MKYVRRFGGPLRNTATRWGQHATADCIVSVKDIMVGTYDNRDILVVKAFFAC